MNDDVVVAHEFDNSMYEVWAALTEPDQMRSWFFSQIPDFKPEVGFRTKFSVHSGGIDFIHIWRIDEVVPGSFISYNWKYEGFAGDSRVLFELTPIENRIKLKVSHLVLEPFPAEIPEFQRESCLAGWTYFINEMLNKHLAKK